MYIRGLWPQGLCKGRGGGREELHNRPSGAALCNSRVVSGGTVVGWGLDAAVTSCKVDRDRQREGLQGNVELIVVKNVEQVHFPLNEKRQNPLNPNTLLHIHFLH